MLLELPHNSTYIADLLPTAFPSHLSSSNNVSCLQLFWHFFCLLFLIFIFNSSSWSYFCLPFPSLPIIFHSFFFSFLQISTFCNLIGNSAAALGSFFFLFFFFSLLLKKPQLVFWIFKIHLRIKVFVFRINEVSLPSNRLFHLIEGWEELSVCLVALGKIHCYTAFYFSPRLFRVGRCYYRESFGWSWHTRAAVDMWNGDFYFVQLWLKGMNCNKNNKYFHFLRFFVGWTSLLDGRSDTNLWMKWKRGLNSFYFLIRGIKTVAHW